MKQYTIVQTEDSLQLLAKMDTSELYALLDKTILAEEKAAQELREREKKAKENQQNNTNSPANNNLNLLNNAQGG